MICLQTGASPDTRPSRYEWRMARWARVLPAMRCDGITADGGSAAAAPGPPAQTLLLLLHLRSSLHAYDQTQTQTQARPGQASRACSPSGPAHSPALLEESLDSPPTKLPASVLILG